MHHTNQTQHVKLGMAFRKLQPEGIVRNWLEVDFEMQYITQHLTINDKNEINKHDCPTPDQK